MKTKHQLNKQESTCTAGTPFIVPMAGYYESKGSTKSQRSTALRRSCGQQLFHGWDFLDRAPSKVFPSSITTLFFGCLHSDCDISGSVRGLRCVVSILVPRPHHCGAWTLASEFCRPFSVWWLGGRYYSHLAQRFCLLSPYRGGKGFEKPGERVQSLTSHPRQAQSAFDSVYGTSCTQNIHKCLPVEGILLFSPTGHPPGAHSRQRGGPVLLKILSLTAGSYPVHEEGQWRADR